MSDRPLVEPELQAGPPRCLRLRREAYEDWSNIRLMLRLWAGAILPGAAGLWLFPSVPPLGLALCVFGGLLLLVAGLITVGVVGMLARDAWLVRYGCAVSGTVVENRARPIPDDFGGFHDVYYRFLTREGDVVEGCWSHAEPPLWGCRAGEPVTILYLARNPRQNLAYACARFQART